MGDVVMKVAKALLFAIIVVLIMPVAMAPALAWSWPIFGFGAGIGSPLAGAGGPSPILPGTPEWALTPTLGAQLVPPGFGYGVSAFHGSIDFGLAPPSCRPILSLPGNSLFNGLSKFG